MSMRYGWLLAWCLVGCVADPRSVDLATYGVIGDLPAPDLADLSIPDLDVIDQATGIDQTAPADLKAAFSPAALAGLVMWLDAQATSSLTVSNGRVSQWNDRTAFQNTAAAATGAEPALGTDALSGKPVLLFSRASGTFMSVPAIQKNHLEWGTTTDFTVVLVASYGSPSGGILFAKADNQVTEPNALVLVNPSGSKQLVYGLNQPMTTTYGVTSPLGYDDAKLRVYVATRRAAGLDLALRVNGVEVVSKTLAAPIDVSNLGLPLQIGGRNATSEQMTGSVAEIVLVKGALTSSELLMLESYLLAKWAL